MSTQQQNIQQFKQKFQSFIKPHKCQHHQKTLNIICIETQCKNKGLICSTCLTINNKHQNHDAVDVVQYVQNCMKQNNKAKDKCNDQVYDLLNRMATVYQELLNLLTSFVQNCNKIIKTYISQRSQLHQTKIRQISNLSVTKKVLQCNFSSLAQANKLLKSLSTSFITNQQKKPTSQIDKSYQKAQFYVDDISYQVCFIGKQLKKIQSRVKQILTVKQSSPIVLSYQPNFYQPTLLQNSQLIYIGQTKNFIPHGKGICFYKKQEKVIFGQFSNGKTQGIGQLYYSTGDYYLGQFKSDKKSGRGIYRWNGKQSSVYQGQFKSGRRNGRGTFWWSDGSKYVGNFVQGQQTGYGTLYRVKNNIQYEGYWLNGLFNGKGIQYFSNGQIYQGQFKSDSFHGSGILKKQKQTIIGKWEQNQLVQVTKQQKINQKS